MNFSRLSETKKANEELYIFITKVNFPFLRSDYCLSIQAIPFIKIIIHYFKATITTL